MIGRAGLEGAMAMVIVDNSILGTERAVGFVDITGTRGVSTWV